MPLDGGCTVTMAGRALDSTAGPMCSLRSPTSRTSPASRRPSSAARPEHGFALPSARTGRSSLSARYGPHSDVTAHDRIDSGVRPRVDRQLMLYQRRPTERLAAVEDPEHLRLLHHFAIRHRMRRLRAKAERGRLGRSQTNQARQEVTQAGIFLTWLADRGRTIDRRLQADLDAWHTEKPATRPQLAGARRGSPRTAADEYRGQVHQHIRRYGTFRVEDAPNRLAWDHHFANVGRTNILMYSLISRLWHEARRAAGIIREITPHWLSWRWPEGWLKRACVIHSTTPQVSSAVDGPVSARGRWPRRRRPDRCGRACRD
jgi:hypothetical protein